MRDSKLIKIFPLVLIFFLLFIQYGFSQESGKVILFGFIVNKNDTVILKTFEVTDGTVTIFKSNVGDYKLKIISTDEKTLFDTNLNFVFEFHKEIVQPDGTIVGETVYFNETEQFFRLPYFSNVDRIEIYHFDKLIFQYNITKEGAVCGNNVCEAGETPTNCPQDCFATTETVPPTRPSGPTEAPGIPIYVYVIIGAVIVVIIILFLKKLRIQA